MVSGVYDPVGLVTPANQKGAILVRRAFQEAKDGSAPVSETWDTALSDGLREKVVKLFEECDGAGPSLTTQDRTRGHAHVLVCPMWRSG